MAEDERFDALLADALTRYAMAMPTRVDAAAVTRRVAGERRQRAWRTVLDVHPRAAWAFVALALMLALVGVMAVGARLLERLGTPMSLGQITVVAGTDAPGDPAAVTSTDGAVWLLPGTGLARYDPATGDTRVWTAADDIAFQAMVLAPDRQGGVWLAGWNGSIRRFDGSRLGDTLTPPGGKQVTALLESADGTLWVATDGGGLATWSNGTWSTAAGVGADLTVLALEQDHGGAVWAALAKYPGPLAAGVARIDGRASTVYTADDRGGSLGQVLSLAADPAGGVWAGTLDGLIRFDGAAWRRVRADAVTASGEWRPQPAADGSIWAVTGFREGPVAVAHASGETWTTWGPAAGLPDVGTGGYSAARLVVTTRGPVVASSSAVYVLDGDRWQLAWRDARPSYGRVWGLAPSSGVDAWLRTATADTKTALWHVTASGGIAEVLPASIIGVNDVALGPDGSPWIATHGGVLTKRDGAWLTVDPDAASGVHVSPDGRIWAASPGPRVRVIEPVGDGWTAHDLGAPNGQVSMSGTGVMGPELAVDGTGHVWLAPGGLGWGRDPGLWRLEGSSWVLTEPPGSPSGAIFGSLRAAPDGSIWVTLDGSSSLRSCCTARAPEAEVARWRDGTWTVFGVQDGLPAEEAQLSLAVTTDGTAWLSTSRGLYRYDVPSSSWTLAKSGIYFDTIVAAPDGALWSTGTGVLRISSPGR